MNEANIQVINVYRNYFVRNKDHSIMLDILRENRERTLLLNTHHNIIEVHYFIGQLGCDHKGNIWEKTDIDWFGSSFDILDTLFEKYQNNEIVLRRLARFCLGSKSKSYWIFLKDKSFAGKVMAAMLGAPDEDV
jgi:hypothetical protein